MEPTITWPKLGDRLFSGVHVAGRSVRFDQGDGCSRIEAMGLGYFEAAERLVESTTTDHYAAGRLAYPILFLYRQAIELSLKQVIGLYGPQVGVSPIWSTHDLEKLWRTYADIAQRLGAMADPADQVVETLIGELAHADPGSYNFRYPVDTKGRAIPIAEPTIDLVALKATMQGLWTYLWGGEEYFDYLVGQPKA